MTEKRFGLRLREETRARLWQEAKRRGVPVNKELCERLERSLEAETARSLEQVAADVVKRLRAAG